MCSLGAQRIDACGLGVQLIDFRAQIRQAQLILGDHVRRVRSWQNPRSPISPATSRPRSAPDAGAWSAARAPPRVRSDPAMGTKISSLPSSATAAIGADSPGPSTRGAPMPARRIRIGQIPRQVLEVRGAGILQQHLQSAAGGDVHLTADLPHAQDEIHHPAHFTHRRRVCMRFPCGGECAAHDGIAGGTGAGANALPDLLA